MEHHQAKRGAGSGWVCGVCTLENQAAAVKCEACGNNRPPKPVPAAAVWACPSCTYENKAAVERCDVCKTAKPVVVASPWSCSACSYLNAPSHGSCLMCGVVKGQAGSNSAAAASTALLAGPPNAAAGRKPRRSPSKHELGELGAALFQGKLDGAGTAAAAAAASGRERAHTVSGAPSSSGASTALTGLISPHSAQSTTSSHVTLSPLAPPPKAKTSRQAARSSADALPQPSNQELGAIVDAFAGAAKAAQAFRTSANANMALSGPGAAAVAAAAASSAGAGPPNGGFALQPSASALTIPEARIQASDLLTIHDVLRDKELRDAFKQFCESEFMDSHVQFLEDVDDYEHLQTPVQRKSKAKDLWDRYIARTAPSFIQFDRTIAKGIASRAAQLPVDLFHDARDFIITGLRLDHFQRFVEQPVYRAALRKRQLQRDQAQSVASAAAAAVAGAKRGGTPAESPRTDLARSGQPVPLAGLVPAAAPAVNTTFNTSASTMRPSSSVPNMALLLQQQQNQQRVQPDVKTAATATAARPKAPSAGDAAGASKVPVQGAGAAPSGPAGAGRPPVSTETKLAAPKQQQPIRSVTPTLPAAAPAAAVRSPGDIFAEAEAQAREDRITGRGMPSKEPQSEVHKLFHALQISKAYADACVAEDLQEVADLFHLEADELEQLIPVASERSKLLAWMSRKRDQQRQRLASIDVPRPVSAGIMAGAGTIATPDGSNMTGRPSAPPVLTRAPSGSSREVGSVTVAGALSINVSSSSSTAPSAGAAASAGAQSMEPVAPSPSGRLSPPPIKTEPVTGPPRTPGQRTADEQQRYQMLRARLHASTRNLNISDVEDGKQQQNRAGSGSAAGAIAGTGAGDQKQGSEQRKPPLPLASHPPLDQFKARARLLPPAPIMEPISPASALSGGSPVHSPGPAPSPRPALPPRPSGAASPPVGPRKTVAAASGSTAGGERDDAMRQKQAADFTRELSKNPQLKGLLAPLPEPAPQSLSPLGAGTGAGAPSTPGHARKGTAPNLTPPGAASGTSSSASPGFGAFSPPFLGTTSSAIANRSSSRLPSDPAPTEEDRQKAREKMDKVIHEIIASEKSYVQHLNLLCGWYLQPLKSEETRRSMGLVDDDVSHIFSNIETIAHFHRVMVMDVENTPPEHIAQVFSRNAPYLKLYTEYVSSYDTCLQTVNKLSMNKHWQRFVEEQRNNKVHQGLDLLSYLIMPVQRIPRYELLLKELRKQSLAAGASEEQLKEVTSAIEAVTKIAQYVNEHKRQAENTSEVLKIRSRVTAIPTDMELVQPSRRLIRVGQLKYKRKGVITTSTRPCMVVLFNDALMWTKPSWRYEGWIDLSKAALHEWEDLSVSVLGQSKDETLQIVFDSPADKQAWTQELNNAVAALKTTLSSLARARRNSIVRSGSAPDGAVAADIAAGDAPIDEQFMTDDMPDIMDGGSAGGAFSTGDADSSWGRFPSEPVGSRGGGASIPNTPELSRAAKTPSVSTNSTRSATDMQGRTPPSALGSASSKKPNLPVGSGNSSSNGISSPVNGSGRTSAPPALADVARASPSAALSPNAPPLLSEVIKAAAAGVPTASRVAQPVQRQPSAAKLIASIAGNGGGGSVGSDSTFGQSPPVPREIKQSPSASRLPATISNSTSNANINASPFEFL